MPQSKRALKGTYVHCAPFHLFRYLTPPSLRIVGVVIASRIRCSMNQAVFCVTPSDRASSQELIPILKFAIVQTATNQWDSGRGESSKIVPTFAENCLPQALSLQRSIRRVLI